MRALPILLAIVSGCTSDYAVPIDAPHTMGSGDGGSGSNVGGTTISITLNGLPVDPTLFSFIAAYQDGSGAWTAAGAPTAGEYTFTVASPTWAFAYTCEASVTVIGKTTTTTTSVRDVIAFHFAVSERTNFTATLPPRCSDDSTNVRLTGTVSNRKTTGGYIIDFNGREAVANATNGTYAIDTPPGTHDLIVMHGANGGTAGDFVADSAIVQRNLAVTAATTANVSGNNASNVQSFGVTVSGTPTSEDSETVLYTANGTVATLGHWPKAPLKTESLNTGQVATGDVYDQEITVATTLGEPVTTTNATATPAAQTYAATPSLGIAMASSAASTPYPRVTTTWPAYASAIGYTWTTTQIPPAASCDGLAPCQITWTAALSPGAAGTSPTYTMPDLSMVAGWSADFQLASGTAATGSVTAVTSSAGAVDYPVGPPVAGTTRVFAASQFGVTP